VCETVEARIVPTESPKGGEEMKKFVIREVETLKTTAAAMYCTCGC
jgi:hypothetical protein